MIRFLKIAHLSGLLLLAACHAALAQRITMTVTVTNRAVTSNSFTANASVRVFTNVTGALTIATNLTSINATKTNLFNQVAAFPLTGITLADGTGAADTGTNAFRLFSSFGGALSGSITGNWGFLTLSTQTGPSTFTMLYPVANIIGTTNQTNQSSDMISAMDTFATNRFGTNFTGPLSNYLNKGASPVQSVSGPVQLNGRTAVASNFFATNGFTVALTNINPITSNLVNYGNAIRSEGSGANSLQMGSNALANGLRAVTVGNNSISALSDSVTFGNSSSNGGTSGTVIGTLSTNVGPAEGTIVGFRIYNSGSSSVGVGSSFSMTNSEQVSIGYAPINRGVGAISIGSGPTAASDFNIAHGFQCIASNLYAMAFGALSSALHSNSAAIGPPDHTGTATATTTTNQMVLGTANHVVYIPGVLSVPSYSNITAQVGSTNRFPAGSDISFGRSTIATVANGHNTINVGTNVYVDLTGAPTAAWTWGGIAGGNRDGKLLKVRNSTGWATDIIHNSGTEPTASLRITTPTSTNITLNASGWAEFLYDTSASRWQLVNVFNTATPAASATNALASLSTNGVQVTAAWTNENRIYGSNIVIRTTNTSGNVATHISGERGLKLIFTLTNSVTVTNTTSATSLITNALWGTNIIPANTLIPGKSLRLSARGYMTSASATTTEFGVRLNNALVLATNLAALPTTLVSDAWEIDLLISARTSGASGSVFPNGTVAWPSSTGSGTAVSGKRMQNGLVASAVTADTTVDQVFNLYVTPGATTHGFTLTTCTLELLE